MCNEKQTNIHNVHGVNEEEDMPMRSMYDFIPESIHSFVSDRFEVVDDTFDGRICITVSMNDPNQNLSIVRSKNSIGPIHARIQTLDSIDKLMSVAPQVVEDITLSEESVSEIKELWKKVEKSVTTSGWQLSYSHSMGERYLWGYWDVIIQENEWSEEKLLIVWEAFLKFNHKVFEVLELEE